MNAAITRFLHTLNAYYDKLIAMAVLLVLLISLLILLIRVSTDKAEHERFKRDLQSLVPMHPQPDPLDLTLFENAIARLRQPDQIAPWDRRMATPEVRVHCVNCERPILYDATVCPYCQHNQPEDAAPTTDWDGDLMPDAWEEKYGLDPRDPSDADLDLDGDGFTNLEEYLFGTNPADPTSFPPPWVRLRLDTIESDPFNMLFMGVSRLGEKQLFQVNLRAGGRTYWKEMGEEVEGFTLTNYEEIFEERQRMRVDVSVLTLTRGDLNIPLIKGKATPHLQHRATLIFEIDRSRHELIRGSEFTIRDHRYQVVAIDADARRVQLRDQAGETLWVSTESVAARRLREARRSATPAGD